MMHSTEGLSFYCSLVICSNNVASRGLCAVAKAMKTNTSLQACYIWGNKLEEPACRVSKTCLLYYAYVF